MAEEEEKVRTLADRFVWAEGQVTRDRPPEKKKWKIVYCPSCQKKVEYLPKAEWRGMLKCPHCEVTFKVPSLDGFVEEEAS